MREVASVVVLVLFGMIRGEQNDSCRFRTLAPSEQQSRFVVWSLSWKLWTADTIQCNVLYVDNYNTLFYPQKLLCLKSTFRFLVIIHIWFRSVDKRSLSPALSCNIMPVMSYDNANKKCLCFIDRKCITLKKYEYFIDRKCMN